MDKKEYLKNYKKYYYNKTRKIITFPLLIEDFEKLAKRAKKYGFTTNSFSKNIVLDYLNNTKTEYSSKEAKEFIQEYMRISRGIANNINQMAKYSNMGEMIDINILIQSLKSYEDEFKKFISKIV